MTNDSWPPKYAALEIERRWLVRGDAERWTRDATEVRCIEDRYIERTHVRLRKVQQHHETTLFKLGKKYVEEGARWPAIVNTYLSAEEYEVFADLPAEVFAKTRYSVAGGALDVYERPQLPFALFEREFDSEQAAAAYVPPPFVGEEVTDEPGLTRYMRSHLPGHGPWLTSLRTPRNTSPR